MKILRKLLDDKAPLFHKGGKLEFFFPFYELVDTFLFTPGRVTKSNTHVKDGIDLKRVMSTVVIALIPCMLMAMYNTGFQIHSTSMATGMVSVGIRAEIMTILGLAFDPNSILSNMVHGLLYFLPVYIVCNIAGGLVEVAFAMIRRHDINEGFFVTGALIPLTLPPTIPLWQVAIGTIFGVLIGKEVFGGTGKNFLNPALTARAFLFFAYPGQISGDLVWTAVDGYSGATALAQAAVTGPAGISYSWLDAFLGLIPGSMGETSTLACLVGAFILIASGIGSWRIMVSVLLGGLIMSLFFNIIGSDTNPLFQLSPLWHLVLGGFAFGAAFMATDPVSASITHKGQFFYGLLIGVMAIMIRVVNPAFPEGMMLAILFANCFAPLIDYYVVKSKIKKRMQKYV